MKKRVALGIVAALVLSTGVAMASPMEMQEGKWNVNAGVMFNPDTEAENSYASSDFDGDTSFFGGVTYGITDKWGVQLDYSHYDSVHHFGGPYKGYSLDMQVDATEVNVLYSLNPNLSAYAGYVYAGMAYAQNSPVAEENFSAGTHVDGVQVGLQGWYPLGDKVKTFGKVGIGNNSRVYEIGFSYAVSENWDVDLSYRDAEYKDFEFMDVVADVNYDGVRLGVSTSF